MDVTQMKKAADNLRIIEATMVETEPDAKSSRMILRSSIFSLEVKRLFEIELSFNSLTTL